jgi:ferredoxin-thioredoxin reductase catalytic subunit
MSSKPIKPPKIAHTAPNLPTALPVGAASPISRGVDDTRAQFGSSEVVDIEMQSSAVVADEEPLKADASDLESDSDEDTVETVNSPGKLPKPVKTKYSNTGKTHARNSLYAMGGRSVISVCLAVGADPFHKPRESRRFVLLAMIIGTLLSLIPVVGHILKTVFRTLNTEYTRTILILERLKHMGVPEAHLPKNAAHWKAVIKHFEKEFEQRSTYTASDGNITHGEISALVKRVRRFDNATMPISLQRYFGIAVKAVANPCCYSIWRGFCNMCFFAAWYGGSHAASHQTIVLLKNANVPCSQVSYALDNWKAVWAVHVKALFQRAYEDYAGAAPTATTA